MFVLPWKTAAPHAVTKHGHGLVLIVFLLRERTAQQRRHAKRGKDLTTHARRAHRDRIACADNSKRAP